MGEEMVLEQLNSRFHVHYTALVLPPKGTEPSGIMYLSGIDQHLSYYVRNLFFFTDVNSPLMIIDKLKDALSNLLVPYNLYAGRLRLNESNNRLELDCNNAGALFASVTCDASVQEITGDKDLDGFFVDPSKFAEKSLDKMPLFTLQVTAMRDNGFAIGVMNHHIGADAMSGTYMLMNLACIARGEEICLVPDCDRTQLMVKAGQRRFVHSEFKLAEPEKKEQVSQFSVRRGKDWAKLLVECENIRKSLAVATDMKRKTYTFHTKQLAALKEAALGDGSVVAMCSTFEVLAAFVWKAHSKAKFDKGSPLPVKLQFVVDVRNILEPPLGIKFCGNAYYPVCTDQVSSDQLITESLSETVGRVRRAKEMLSDEYVRSGWEYLEAHPQYWYQHDCTTVINAWPRLMQKVVDLDFGWGKPHRVEFPRDPRNTKVFFFPFSKDGILVSVCLSPAQFLEFETCIGIS